MSLENMMEPTGELSSDQIGAIRHSVRIGSLLVNDHPEIAELYRGGMSYSEIAENLDVKVKYGIPSDRVSRNSIRYAITGHTGSFGTGPYDGLIQNLDELAELEHEHRAENGRKTAAEGTGIHGYNPETGLSYRAEGGKIGGTKTAELGLGAHGLTPEQRFEYGRIGGRIGGRKGGRIGGRKGGRKAALAKGQTLWGKEETESAYLLSLEPKYQHQKGSWKGKSDYKTITQVLNDDYHNGGEVRSPAAVKRNLSKYIKTLGK